jgi:large subunit ribosomal protein L32
VGEAAGAEAGVGPGRAERPAAASLPGPMAVPKKKQSHSRTAKRRAQHKIVAPSLNACPRCHSPRRPHRVCAVCGTYAGREVTAAVEHVEEHHDHQDGR